MPVAVSCSEALEAALKREGLDTVAGAFAYAGGDDLHKAGLNRRRRTRLMLTDEAGRTHELYLKRYGRGRLLDRAGRLWTYRRRCSLAGIEFENVQAVRAAGIPTMREVAFGQEQGPLGPGRSYIIVTAVPGDALERCGEEFLSRHRNNATAAEALTDQLASLLKKLHGSGYVHRDMYASHIFLDERRGETFGDTAGETAGDTSGKTFGKTAPQVDLYLIDLARMFSPRWRLFRWCVKDLAQLKYSMPMQWVEDWWARFLAAYLGRCDDALKRRYDRAIDRKVAVMRRRG